METDLIIHHHILIFLEQLKPMLSIDRSSLICGAGHCHDGNCWKTAFKIELEPVQI